MRADNPALKENVQRALAAGRQAHEEVLGEGLIVCAGTIDMLISAVRLLATALWRPPAEPTPAPEAPPTEPSGDASA